MIASLFALAAAILLGIGYAGWLHPAGDSFAVFRPQLAGLLLASVVLAAWPNPVKLIAGAFAIWAGVSVFWPRSNPPQDESGLALYQQNLRFSRADHEAWLQAVEHANVDLLTLQEVSDRNRIVLDRLSDRFPTQVYCDFAAVGGVAVLARYPAVPATQTCSEGLGLAAIQIETPDGQLWLVSLHLHWPWPYRQSAQLDALQQILEAFDGSVVIGGDFNSVAWSHALSRVERATGTRRIGPKAATFSVKGVRLGIDHVLTSLDGASIVEVQPRLGSDHHGLIARLPPFP